ncbi:MAG: His-Xaa-Ser system radical SAM maturase HxsC [Candidatus Pedobacter colombiensis]|uniref:His-Xaa-Ser system radical SAM maturase HxsC n=1 Tax=Candidatus Pedobacter colombiensis TaxID=3121371 RepID=A0AAJ5WFJ8_9SPHI|nr:His-Xaa-Ser system radical SAM maturase HxsC [Pedobacter sp.]WEK21657.1 MAG: His-Xaa-Ser system radical SAM maturase HxsC [Pedobacter sp.]
MLLKTKGKTSNITEPIVARVTRNRNSSSENQVLICEDYFVENNDFAAILTNLNANPIVFSQHFVHSIQSLSHLNEGDIIVINSDGVINTLYRANSHQNFLLATERCNSNCLMCSQPPRDREDIYYLHNLHRKLIPLIPKDCVELGITGGEPTLLGNLFYELLAMIQSELPDTDIHCLTNGRSFAWPNLANKLGAMKYDKLMLGIPLYSDFYQTHDYIVQAKDAFNQTIQGLYNLARNNLRIEIRIVLHQQSIPRLKKLAQYIYKNLPFVEHITFMGLEHQGYTPFNIDKLWIDPVDYMDDLTDAVTFLSDKDMNVSIYNSQLCLLPRELWQYSRKSISDWKNVYLDECQSCGAIAQCGGLFASGQKKHSAHIKGIQL